MNNNSIAAAIQAHLLLTQDKLTKTSKVEQRVTKAPARAFVKGAVTREMPAARKVLTKIVEQLPATPARWDDADKMAMHAEYPFCVLSRPSARIYDRTCDDTDNFFDNIEVQSGGHWLWKGNAQFHAPGIMAWLGKKSGCIAPATAAWAMWTMRPPRGMKLGRCKVKGCINPLCRFKARKSI